MTDETKQYETREFAGEIVATKSNGVEVPIEFTFTYPKGEGIVLMKVVERFGEHVGTQRLFDYLLAVQDESFIAAALRARAEDDDYENEEL
ncbi:hypothetical protein [Brachybacterium nesterenkovii]|uniref:hypothetical protein n=1 Tax=Brachybacterium nesterenkovii TaxID=47847 RepID=UPI003219CF90